MTFQPRTRTPRTFGRRREKTKPKAKSGKQPSVGGHRLVEEHVPTSKEVVDRSLNMLHHLGSQRFAVAPFYDHFDRWLLSLRTVVTEFESSPAIDVDDQFHEESSQMLSEIELALEERRLNEASRQEDIRKVNQSLLEARSFLAQAERQYAAKMKEIADRKERAIKPVAGRVGKLREELNRIVRMRAGFLWGISKKAKAQKEVETTQRLETTRRELENVEQSFVIEQATLRDEYKKRRQQLLEQISSHQKELDKLGSDPRVDDAIEIRRAACDALIGAVNTFLERSKLSSGDDVLSA